MMRGCIVLQKKTASPLPADVLPAESLTFGNKLSGIFRLGQPAVGGLSPAAAARSDLPAMLDSWQARRNPTWRVKGR